MEYLSMVDVPPFKFILLSILQTGTLFAGILLGLKLVGRRVFGEKGPQDLVILVLIGEASNLGLSHQEAGYWGSVSSVVCILLLGFLCERVTFIRRFLEGRPIFLYERETLNRTLMEQHMVDEADLDLAAREYGLASYHDFSTMVLEGDGAVTGVVRPHPLTIPKQS
jgi:uncharacterized membrane protein YcaP (DUF421 family)